MNYFNFRHFHVKPVRSPWLCLHGKTFHFKYPDQPPTQLGWLTGFWVKLPKRGRFKLGMKTPIARPGMVTGSSAFKMEPNCRFNLAHTIRHLHTIFPVSKPLLLNTLLVCVCNFNLVSYLDLGIVFHSHKDSTFCSPDTSNQRNSYLALSHKVWLSQMCLDKIQALQSHL